MNRERKAFLESRILGLEEIIRQKDAEIALLKNPVVPAKPKSKPPQVAFDEVKGFEEKE